MTTLSAPLRSPGPFIAYIFLYFALKTTHFADTAKVISSCSYALRLILVSELHQDEMIQKQRTECM